jgi:hypothetical protein
VAFRHPDQYRVVDRLAAFLEKLNASLRVSGSFLDGF